MKIVIISSNQENCNTADCDLRNGNELLFLKTIQDALEYFLNLKDSALMLPDMILVELYMDKCERTGTKQERGYYDESIGFLFFIRSVFLNIARVGIVGLDVNEERQVGMATKLLFSSSTNIKDNLINGSKKLIVYENINQSIYIDAKINNSNVVIVATNQWKIAYDILTSQ